MASRIRASSVARLVGASLLLIAAAACGGPQPPQPPAAPSNVTATPGPGYVTVQWQDNSDDETGFDIYRSGGEKMTTQQAGAKVGSVGADETSFVDMDVELDQEFSYSVVAVNAVGGSEPSAAPGAASVPVGVDLMVGTLNRTWSEDTNGTIFVVYFVFPDEVLEDQSDVFTISITGPPGWNEDNPRGRTCAWDQCSRAQGFMFDSNNARTAIAGEYTVTVVAGGVTYTASAALTDPDFRLARPTDVAVTDASAAGGTVTWTAPPGAVSHIVQLFRGEYDEGLGEWYVDQNPALTIDDQALEDDIYLVQAMPLNADLFTYPLKVEPFGQSYEARLFGVGDIHSPACTSGDQVITIPDAALLQAVRGEIGAATGDITCTDMAVVKSIWAPSAGIASLEGLQYAVNLEELFMPDNDVSDLTPLAGLTKIWHLNVNVNDVTDVSPLANLTELFELHICCSVDNITDVTPLEGLTKVAGLNITGHALGDAVLWPLLENYPDLRGLWTGENALTDFSALANHPNLEILQISGNDVDDLSVVADLEHLVELYMHWAVVDDLTPLHSMTQLTAIDLRGLQLTDISFLEAFAELQRLDVAYNELTSLAPIVANVGIGSGDWVDVRNNPLDLNDANVQAQIQALLDRGVDLQYQ